MYKPKTFTLPEETLEKLAKEKNQSGVIDQALHLYWDNQSTIKRIVAFAERLENRLDAEPPKTFAKIVPQKRCCAQDKTMHYHWQRQDDELVNVVTGARIDV